MAAKEFLKFLSDLANESSVQSDYSSDPDGTMDKYGLDDTEKAAVKSRDAGTIGDLVKTHVDAEKTAGVAW